jgi:hypothetical protein
MVIFVIHQSTSELVGQIDSSYPQMKIHQIASARFDGGELPHLGSCASEINFFCW